MAKLTPELLSVKQTAVLGAVAIHAVKRPELAVEPIAKIFQVACRLLQNTNQDLSKKEFDEILNSFFVSDLIKFDSGNPVLSALLTTPKIPKCTDDVLVEVLRGSSLFMTNKHLGDDFTIEFNYDGKGGIRLLSGEIVSDTTLHEFSERLYKEKNIVLKDGSGKNSHWFICPKHHPEAPKNKNERVLREYFKSLWSNNKLD